MNDKQFLFWIYQRMSRTHGEPLNIDYMGRFASIIDGMPCDQITSNTMTDISHLKEADQ